MEQQDSYQIIRDSLHCGAFEYQKDPITQQYYLSAGNSGLGSDREHQKNVAHALSDLGFDVKYINDRASVHVVDIEKIITEQSQSIHSPIQQPPITLSDLINPQTRQNFNAYADQIEIKPNGHDVTIHSIGAALCVIGVRHVLYPEKKSVIATDGDSIIKIKKMTHNINPQQHQTLSQ